MISLAQLRERLNNYQVPSTKTCLDDQRLSDTQRVPYIIGHIKDNDSCIPPRLKDFLKDYHRPTSPIRSSCPTKYDHRENKLQVSDAPKAYGRRSMRRERDSNKSNNCDMKSCEVNRNGYANEGMSRDCLDESSLVSLDRHQSNLSLADDATTTSGSFTIDLEDLSVDLEELGAATESAV